MKRIFLILLVVSTTNAMAVSKWVNIRTVNFGRLLWDDFKEKCPSTIVEVNELEIMDITGDGKEDALVIASSCLSDPSGPDIHRAYTLTIENTMAELKFDRKKKYSDVDFKQEILGRTNYTYQFKDGYVIENHHDASGRSIALRIWYKWNGKKFAVENAWRGKIFKPVNINCARSMKDVERAICRIESLADNHNRLDEKLTHLNEQLKGGERAKLRREQTAWLASREKDCPLSGSFVECLTSLYLSRIDDLNNRITGGDKMELKITIDEAPKAEPSPALEPGDREPAAEAPTEVVVKPAAEPSIDLSKPVDPPIEIVKPAPARSIDLAKPAAEPSIDLSKPAAPPTAEMAKEETAEDKSAPSSADSEE